jgi:hypothetical protein
MRVAMPVGELLIGRRGALTCVAMLHSRRMFAHGDMSDVVIACTARPAGAARAACPCDVLLDCLSQNLT